MLPPSEGDSLGVAGGSGEGWTEYRRLVLGELVRIERDIGSLHDKFDDLKTNDIGAMRVEIAMLKVKAGLVGAMTGTLTGLAVAIGTYLIHGTK